MSTEKSLISFPLTSKVSVGCGCKSSLANDCHDDDNDGEKEEDAWSNDYRSLDGSLNTKPF